MATKVPSSSKADGMATPLTASVDRTLSRGGISIDRSTDRQDTHTTHLIVTAVFSALSASVRANGAGVLERKAKSPGARQQPLNRDTRSQIIVESRRLGLAVLAPARVPKLHVQSPGTRYTLSIFFLLILNRVPECVGHPLHRCWLCLDDKPARRHSVLLPYTASTAKYCLFRWLAQSFPRWP